MTATTGRAGVPEVELAADFTLRVGALTVEVDLRVDARGALLVGPNGAGKTSTLLALLGVRRPERGTIRLGGRTLLHAEAGIDVPPGARGLVYMPQDLGLFPHLSAADNVAFALECRPGAPPARVRRARARELLGRLGIAGVAERRPAALSGGERQRVALARALALDPGGVILDEPLAALDVEARAEVRAFLAAELAALGRPFVLVSHDRADLAAFAAPIWVLEAGRVAQRGTLDELARAPATPFVAALVGAPARAPGAPGAPGG